MKKLVYDAIIFDFDGVLVQSMDIKTKAFATLYKAYGQRIIDEVVNYHNMHGGVSRYEKFRYFHNTLLGMSLSEEEMENLDRKFSQIVMQSVIDAPEVLGAQAFLQQFHHLLSYHVASATPHAELVNIIDKRHLSSYFTSIHGSPENKINIIDKILKKNGYKNNRVVMIGDALSDLQAALTTNIQFIGCISTNENVFPSSVSVINNLTELKNFVEITN